MLIEKAWAKINGSYAAIRRSTQSFLGIHITGVPAENISHDAIKSFRGGTWQTDYSAVDKVWQRLSGALERYYTVVCNAREKDLLDQRKGIDPRDG